MLVTTLALLTLSGQAGDPEVGAAPYAEDVICYDDNAFVRPPTYDAVTAEVDGTWWLSLLTDDIGQRNLLDAYIEDNSALELVDGAGAVQVFAATLDSAVLRLQVPPGTLDGATFLLRRVGSFDGLVLTVDGDSPPMMFDVRDVSINAEPARECDAWCVPEDVRWPSAMFLNVSSAGDYSILNVRGVGTDDSLTLFDEFHFVDNVLLPPSLDTSARYQVSRFAPRGAEALSIEVTLTSTAGRSLFSEVYEVTAPDYVVGDFDTDDCNDEYYDDYYGDGLGGPGCGCSLQAGSPAESAAALMLVFILGFARRRRRAKVVA